MQKKSKRVSTRVHTRKLDRLIARDNMKRAGIYRFTHGQRHHSFFANHWREYV